MKNTIVKFIYNGKVLVIVNTNICLLRVITTRKLIHVCGDHVCYRFGKVSMVMVVFRASKFDSWNK